MPKKKHTIHDVEARGFTIGMAHGDVSVEQAALAEAHANATVEKIAADADSVRTQTMNDLVNAGKLVDFTDDEKVALSNQIRDQAERQISEARGDLVAFHTQALKIAASSPDVWVISGEVKSEKAEDGDKIIVENIYVQCKDDGTGWDPLQQETLDALATL